MMIFNSTSVSEVSLAVYFLLIPYSAKTAKLVSSVWVKIRKYFKANSLSSSESDSSYLQD